MAGRKPRGCGGILYAGGHFNVAGPDCQPNHTGTCSTRHHVAAFDTRHNKLLSWNPDANSPHGVFIVNHSRRLVAFGGSSPTSADAPNKASPSTPEAICLDVPIPKGVCTGVVHAGGGRAGAGRVIRAAVL